MFVSNYELDGAGKISGGDIISMMIKFRSYTSLRKYLWTSLAGTFSINNEKFTFSISFCNECMPFSPLSIVSFNLCYVQPIWQKLLKVGKRGFSANQIASWKKKTIFLRWIKTFVPFKIAKLMITESIICNHCFYWFCDYLASWFDRIFFLFVQLGIIIRGGCLFVHFLTLHSFKGPKRTLTVFQFHSYRSCPILWYCLRKFRIISTSF